MFILSLITLVVVLIKNSAKK
ncbi:MULTISPECIES: hypothetical protein [Leuconostoc]|nr:MULTISPECIES: hypothetical protein [Leuconostoc]MDV8932053.1 hypothetical protein [Leuconostoc citreum]UUE18917.1 hypothetical protein LQZ13_06000 [Leuconostoc mesenteroides]